MSKNQDVRVKSSEELKGATMKNLVHPYYEVWQDFLARFYSKPEVKRYAIFMHGSYKKPLFAIENLPQDY